MKIYKIAQIEFTLNLPLSEQDKEQFLQKIQKIPNEDYNITMKDTMGGTCNITVKNKIPHIIAIHSMPFETPISEQDKFKKRGFYKMVLNTLNFLGFKTFTVNIQSIDSQKALARLHDKELISNPRDYFGGSMSIKPHTFDIGKQPILPKNKSEEEDFKHWQDYKKNYLQKI